jgi:very-short-patch-repair endonuclease
VSHITNYISNLSEKERYEIRQKAVKSLLRAAKEGSVLQKNIKKGLSHYGYMVRYNVNTSLREHQLEVDMVVDEPPVAIEIDGPTHRYDIYGTGRLQQVQEADKLKNGLLNELGYTVIRLYSDKPVTIARCVYALNTLLDLLKAIKEKRNNQSIIFVDVE